MVAVIRHPEARDSLTVSFCFCCLSSGPPDSCSPVQEIPSHIIMVPTSSKSCSQKPTSIRHVFKSILRPCLEFSIPNASFLVSRRLCQSLQDPSCSKKRQLEYEDVLQSRAVQASLQTRFVILLPHVQSVFNSLLELTFRRSFELSNVSLDQ